MNYTPIPFDFLEEMEELSDAEYGRLVRWGQKYQLTGEKAKLSGNERFYAKRMQMQIDRYVENYNEKLDQRRRAGQASANARQRPSTDGNETNKTKTNTETKTETNTETNLSSPNGERENKAQAPARFRPPSLEEVAEYCRSRGNKVDPEAFIAFYASKGWKVGNQPMKDWKQAVITWEKRDGGKDRKAPPSAKGPTEEDRKRQEELDKIAIEQVKRLRKKLCGEEV